MAAARQGAHLRERGKSEFSERAERHLLRGGRHCGWAGKRASGPSCAQVRSEVGESDQPPFR